MDSATMLTRPSVSALSSSSSSSSFCFVGLWNRNPNPRFPCISFVKSPRYANCCVFNNLDSSCSPRLVNGEPIRSSCSFLPSASVTNISETSESVTCKVERIVSEFEALREPIDRVKRLLDYAARLPELDESERVPTNRVFGCAVQVWLCVRMDEFGRMRFSADSDSEIAKGFCSCLVWILDGAFPEEVLMLSKEDLEALNIGLYGRAHSRVNTWHNVLIEMQKRTKMIVAVAEEDAKPVIDPFESRLAGTLLTKFKGTEVLVTEKLV